MRAISEMFSQIGQKKGLWILMVCGGLKKGHPIGRFRISLILMKETKFKKSIFPVDPTAADSEPHQCENFGREFSVKMPRRFFF